MKKLLLILLIPIFNYSQTQIGDDMDGEAVLDFSGRKISLSGNGNVVAIGAHFNDGNGDNSGHVRVYQNVSDVWTQIGDDIDGEAMFDISGSSVSLSNDGSIIAIGAPDNDGSSINSGHVRVYKNLSGTWTKIGSDIDGEFGDDSSGYSVSLSENGSIVAIGARGNDGNGVDSGHVRIFKNVSSVWTQVGSDINGEVAGDGSGYTVSLSSEGSIVAIGAILNDGNGVDSGHVRIYQNISDVWTQIGSDIDGEAASDRSGFSISLSSDGSIIAIGARYNDGNGVDSGHVRIYQNVSDIWTQIGSDINGESPSDFSGYSISLSGNGSIVAIGASNNDGNGDNSGHVRIYQYISEAWLQVGNDINGESFGDFSGSSIALSNNGSVVAIGAHFNDENGSESGHVRVYDLSSILATDSFIETTFSIYPNPASETLTISLDNTISLDKVNFYNTLGQLVLTETSKTININTLKVGTYYIQILTNQGMAVKIVVIE